MLLYKTLRWRVQALDITMYTATTKTEGNGKMITIEQMVQREVLCCMSSLVSTLAESSGLYRATKAECVRDIGNLCEQAAELAAPVLDYEEAARQTGWHYQGENTPKGKMSDLLFCNADDEPAKSWEQACEMSSVDAYEREVFEHWAVSQWLAGKLTAQGERVDTDFAGLNIWARTTTGQVIAMDGSIQRIYADMAGYEEIVRQKSARISEWARSQDTV